MKEFNRETLLTAIQKLKVYIPTEKVWDGIDKCLDSEYILEEHLQNMPMHEAPDSIWHTIETNLEEEVKPKARIAFLRPLLAAASVALLGFFFFFNSGNLIAHDEVVVTYSIEDYPIIKFQRDDHNNNAANIALMQMINLQYNGVAPREDQDLLTELKELKIASDKLKRVIGKYDTDRGLIDKLNNIELERKELMDKIFANKNSQG